MAKSGKRLLIELRDEMTAITLPQTPKVNLIAAELNRINRKRAQNPVTLAAYLDMRRIEGLARVYETRSDREGQRKLAILQEALGSGKYDL